MQEKNLIYVILLLVTPITTTASDHQLSRYEKKLKQNHLRHKIQKLVKKMDNITLTKEQLRRKRDKATIKLRRIRVTKTA